MPIDIPLQKAGKNPDSKILSKITGLRPTYLCLHLLLLVQLSPLISVWNKLKAQDQMFGSVSGLSAPGAQLTQDCLVQVFLIDLIYFLYFCISGMGILYHILWLFTRWNCCIFHNDLIKIKKKRLRFCILLWNEWLNEYFFLTNYYFFIILQNSETRHTNFKQTGTESHIIFIYLSVICHY